MGLWVIVGGGGFGPPPAPRDDVARAAIAYLWAAVLYLCLTAIFVWMWRQFEVRLSPQLYGKRSSFIGTMLRGRAA